MDLKIVLGAVNLSPYLRISAAKVSDPTNEVFVDYVASPFSPFTFVITGLDADNYWIRFREAPDTSSLGTLYSEAFVNAQTGEWLYERRFYTIGSLPGGVTSTINSLTDPYLIGKNVSGVFKEGLRYLDPATEYTVDDTVGTITLTVADLSDPEKLVVEIKYKVSASTSTPAVAGIFAGTVNVTGATYTVSSTDKNKRFRLNCTGSKQEVTLCALSALAEGDFLYFEHKRDGAQAQTRIKTTGTDKIYWNGFNLVDNGLTELWVCRGQSLYLRKSADGDFEVIYQYDGNRVGERMSSTYLSMPNWLAEDGTLLDGDEYPALYWWVKNILPSTHKIVDDTVTNGGYSHPSGKFGLFVIHSTLKKFRLPNTQALSEKGLKDFDSYGADTDRTYDYPGGQQDDQNKAHGHRIQRGSGGSGTNPLDSPTSGFSGMDSQTGFIGSATATSNWVEASGGTEVRVKNFGVIFMRHI